MLPPRTLPKLKITGIEEGFTIGFDEGHRTAKDVPRGNEGDPKAGAVELIGGRLAESENMFLSRAPHAGKHQFGGRLADNHLPMRSRMVGMGMTDKYPFGAQYRFMRIEPQTQSGQMHPSIMKMNIKN